MEDFEKKAKLADLIAGQLQHIRYLSLSAQRYGISLIDIPSWIDIKNSVSESSASYYLDEIKTIVPIIEQGFSDIRNFIDEIY